MKKIVVIGDSIIDKYINLDTIKISDEAPVITHKIIDEKFVLGGAANVARNISSLNKRVVYFGLKNKGDIILENLLKKNSVEFFLFEQDKSVPIKTRIISRNQQICRFDNECFVYSNEEHEKKIINYIKNNIFNIQFVIFSKYFDGFLNPKFVNEITKILKENNIRSILDNRQSNSFEFENISFLKLNFNEFQQLIKKPIENSNDQVINELKKISQNSFDSIIVTRSEKDIICLNGKEILIFSIEKSQVVDVSGAGDTFVATFASFFEKNDLSKTINLAKKASKISISKLGTSVVYDYELFNHSDDLSRLIKDLKLNNKKIVFTNGVFDILHSGHIKLLSECKNYGDFLIVGINSDDSVKKNKGNNRPIKNEQIRKNVLESIRFVDYVFVFDEINVINYIDLIKPDFYVKGADYLQKEFPEKNKSKELNVEIKYIELEPDESSSKYINMIKNS